ncbi:phosphoinositide 3-kinase adapter protein 1-like isoform X2 [Asterias rubens]|uniref:phosphoinositide 3-kinase adapter protein 1-like isoform X2 n=1 Tax=Asterias rubens TaxID=7604 RepID=UPI0014552710|nr:phosphoinositide 3-kinase adapter protein 1-like isoform X2 [Asterias rubens]
MENVEDLFDLSILYTQDAIQWCEYLFDIFKDYDIQQNSEDVLDIIHNPSGLENVKNSMMNVVIISPMFLRKCDPKIEEYVHHVVGLLCGVVESDLDELFEMIPSAKNWTQVDARAGGNEITSMVLKVFGDAGKERMPIETEDTYLTMVGDVNSEVQGDYEDMRVKEEPHEMENTYYIRGPAPEEDYEPMKPLAPPGGHVFQPVKDYVDMRGVKNMSHCSPGLNIQPEAATSGEGGVLFVIFQDDLISMKKQDLYVVSFNGKLRKNEVPASKKNPYTLEIQLPKDHPAEIVDCQVMSPSRALMGTFKFHFKSVMDDLTLALLNITDPMKFMCQALGISPADSNELDNILFEHIQHRVPQGGLNLLVSQVGAEQTSILEVPTALHFAAMHGLKSMCFMLSTCPGALQAMKLKNRNGLTPDGLAAKNGHSDLCSLLESFVDGAEDEGIQTEGSGPTSSYLFIKSGFGNSPYYKNEDFLQQVREQTSNYDSPFKVPIPADYDTIKQLMEGEREDIEDFYDSLTLDLRSFERDPDPEEDYEEVLDEMGNRRRSTKKTISRRPQLKQPSVENIESPTGTTPIKHLLEEKAKSTAVTTPVEQKASFEIDASVPELPPTKKVLNVPGVGAEQQTLIDLQNSFKNNKITLDEAVTMFSNFNLIQQSNLPFLSQPEKTHKKDIKTGGLKSFLSKKQPKKGGVSEQHISQSIVYSATSPAVKIASLAASTCTHALGSTPTISQKFQDKSTSELTTCKNRPISTASTTSSSSRGSVLSISDRDSSYSSYSSTIEEVEQDKNQPVLRKQERMNERSTSQQERLKPVPPIPGRSPQKIPQSLQDLPKPVPPIPSPDYSSYRIPVNREPASSVQQQQKQQQRDQQAGYFEFIDPIIDKTPGDLPALPPPPVPSPEVFKRPERISDSSLTPMSPGPPINLAAIIAGKSQLKQDAPITPKKPGQKPVPRPRAPKKD